jgi:hypothetical protein
MAYAVTKKESRGNARAVESVENQQRLSPLPNDRIRPSTRSRHRDLPSLHANLKAEHEMEKNSEEDYVFNINGAQQS